MSIELSILTLNIWGIPWVSADRDVRVRAIAAQLSGGAYDVVSLQEVWSLGDFELIRDRVVDVLPYSHYFYSGVLGSGLCLFSRHPIVGALFHVWPLNGYVHRVHHGDWFGGKGVGLCRLNVDGWPVNVYVAHLHAEYDRENDDYKSHRVLQAFDTAQFIESTRGSAVLQVLAGDLNTEPGDLAYRSLMSVARLTDACSMPGVGTNECSHNAYTAKASKTAAAGGDSGMKTTPQQQQLQSGGKRIDYVLYRGGEAATSIRAVYSLPFPHELDIGDAARKPISYSDHEAVLARFSVQLKSRSDPPAVGVEAAAGIDRTHLDRLRNDLSDGIYLCDETLKLLRSHRTFYLSVAAALVVVLVTVMDATAPYGFGGLFIALRVALSGAVLFALAMGTLWNWSEANAVMGGRLAMKIALQASAADWAM